MITKVRDDEYLATKDLHWIVINMFDRCFDFGDDEAKGMIGAGYSPDEGNVFFDHGSKESLSPTSTVTFLLDFGSPSRGDYYVAADITLNMEEVYYYYELYYYCLLRDRRRTQDQLSWYLVKLAEFRKTCEIKDIYGERLQKFREEYGVTIYG